MFRLSAAVCLLAAAASGQDLMLTSPQGAEVSFASLQGVTTVVVFTSTRCPVSNAYNERMNAIYQDYEKKGVRFVFLNSNFNESAADLVEHARTHELKYTVYKDPTHAAADRFSATVTPEAFVLAGGKVLYHGAVDDAQTPARVTKQSLRLALDAILAGRPVEAAETKAFGCTIKRARKAS